MKSDDQREREIALHILNTTWIVRYKNYVHVFDWVCKILLISLIESAATVCRGALRIRYRNAHAERARESEKKFSDQATNNQNVQLSVVDDSRFALHVFKLSMLLR